MNNVIVIEHGSDNYQRLGNELIKGFKSLGYNCTSLNIQTRCDLLELNILDDTEFVICFENSIMNLPHKLFNNKNIKVVYVRDENKHSNYASKFNKIASFKPENLYGVFVGDLKTKNIPNYSIVHPIITYNSEYIDTYLRPLISRLNFLNIPVVHNPINFLGHRVFVNLSNKTDMKNICAKISGCREITSIDNTPHKVIKQVEDSLTEELDITSILEQVDEGLHNHNILEKISKIFMSFEMTFDHSENRHNILRQNSDYMWFLNNVLRSYAKS